MVSYLGSKEGDDVAAVSHGPGNGVDYFRDGMIGGGEGAHQPCWCADCVIGGSSVASGGGDDGVEEHNACLKGNCDS